MQGRRKLSRPAKIIGLLAVFSASLLAGTGQIRICRAFAGDAAPGYVVEPRAMDRIPPGTPIEQRAPNGWHYLIVKSAPRLAAGDVDKVPQIAARHTTLLFTGILGRVRAEPQSGGQTQQYGLDTVAIGLGTAIKGHDVIVSSETQDRQQAALGPIGRMVLSESEERLKLFTQAARSPTMGIYDIPAIMLRGDQHVPSILRYAILVDPRDGQLFTLVWMVDLDSKGAYTQASSPMRWLARDYKEDCQLHVDAREFGALGIPNARAFAIVDLPKGRSIEMTPGIRELAGQPRFTATTLYNLEKQLWDEVFRVIAQEQEARRPQ
jgi:hypothetical protein